MCVRARVCVCVCAREICQDCMNGSNFEDLKHDFHRDNNSQYYPSAIFSSASIEGMNEAE